MKRRFTPAQIRLGGCLILSLGIHASLLLLNAARLAPAPQAGLPRLSITLQTRQVAPTVGATPLPLPPATTSAQAPTVAAPADSSAETPQPTPFPATSGTLPVPAELLSRRPELINGDILNNASPPAPVSDERVELDLVIDEQGWVREARVVDAPSSPFVDWLLLQMQDKVRFRPGELDGQRVPSTIRMEFQQRIQTSP